MKHLTLLLFLIPGFLFSQTAEERGLAIATEADRRDSGFGDLQVGVTMLLKNKKGQTSIRKTRNKTLEVEGDGDKLLIVFDEPRDVKGTAFLSFTHVKGDDDQWLYLPALKRVKRISTSNKTGPFMGSEFSYEDLVSQEVEKYRYKYLREEELDGRICFVLERYPNDPKSGYKRQIIWIDRETYRSEKVDYFDRKDELLKTLRFTGYNLYLEQFWRSDKMIMVNHQSGKSTDLIWTNYRFRTGLKASDFNQASLKRAR